MIIPSVFWSSRVCRVVGLLSWARNEVFMMEEGRGWPTVTSRGLLFDDESSELFVLG